MTSICEISQFSRKCLLSVFAVIIFSINGCLVKKESGFNNYPSSTNDPAHARSSPSEMNSSYCVGYGDTLKLSVLHHPEYDLEINLPPDESISLPRIPSYSTRGKTVSRIRDELSALLSLHLKSPDVTLNVSKFSSLKILIMGEVNSPGIYPYERDMTLGFAVAAAGGLKDTARKSNIIVIPKKGPPYKTSLSLEKLCSDTSVIIPGDIVYVAEKPINKINVFINQFFAKVDPLLQFYLHILDIDNYDNIYRTR